MTAKLFFATFITILIAELGDKTQFAAIAAGSGTDSTLVVWLAVVLALALSGTIGVMAGSLLGQFLNPAIMKYVSGSMFICIGLWTLFGGSANS